MKRTSILITLIAALMAIPLTATASPLPITIDFSQTVTTDITLPNHYAIINSVIFDYDNTNALINGNFAGAAQVDSTGVTGDTGITIGQNELSNLLEINFVNRPVPQIYKLNIIFNLIGMTKDDPLGAFADFSLLGNFVNHLDVAVLMAQPSGVFVYTGPAFDLIQLSFTTDASKFHISEITYAPVPEPGTIVLVAAGLLGLGVLRRTRKI